MKTVAVIGLALAAGLYPAHANTYQYVCKVHGKSYPLKVDQDQNTLRWKGKTYKITIQEDCGRYGWHAVANDGDSFNFCTATKGGAGFGSGGTECELKPARNNP